MQDENDDDERAKKAFHFWNAIAGPIIVFGVALLCLVIYLLGKIF
jgi:hypothetical protein